MENENEINQRSPTVDRQNSGGRTDTGGKAEVSTKAEGKTPHADKLKSETSRSEAMKGKYRTGKKQTEGTPKLKKSGGGKKKGFKPKVGIPSPPPPGSVNFTGNQYDPDNNSAESIRDTAGNIGVLAIAARKAHPRTVAHYHAHEGQFDAETIRRFSTGKKGELSENALARRNARAGEKPVNARTIAREESIKSGSNKFAEAAKANSSGGTSDSGYASKLSDGKYAKGYKHSRTEEVSEAEISNKTSREIQVKRTRREMMKSAQVSETQSSGFGSSISNFFANVGEKIENVAAKIAETVAMVVKENPLFWGLLAVVCIVIVLIPGSFSAFGLMFSGGGNTVMASSFTAEDSDIRATEKEYQKLEAELREEMNNLKKDHPGYDEYNLNISTITHNEFELAAILTVLHEDYTKDSAKETLQNLIDSQYKLTITEKTEKRKKKETRWHYVTRTREETRYKLEYKDGKYVLTPYTVEVEYQSLESYEVEVEYDYKIFNATLTGKSIDTVVDEMALTDTQKQRYELLLRTKGNKENVFNE